MVNAPGDSAMPKTFRQKRWWIYITCRVISIKNIICIVNYFWFKHCCCGRAFRPETVMQGPGLGWDVPLKQECSLGDSSWWWGRVWSASYLECGHSPVQHTGQHACVIWHRDRHEQPQKNQSINKWYSLIQAQIFACKLRRIQKLRPIQPHLFATLKTNLKKNKTREFVFFNQSHFNSYGTLALVWPDALCKC